MFYVIMLVEPHPSEAIQHSQEKKQRKLQDTGQKITLTNNPRTN